MKELQLGSLARERVIEVGADQLEGAGAGRELEGGEGKSWPVGGNSGSSQWVIWPK